MGRAPVRLRSVVPPPVPGLLGPVLFMGKFYREREGGEQRSAGPALTRLTLAERTAKELRENAQEGQPDSH
jgi:hypothetical protein